MALQASDTASPFGWLGRLKLEHGRIDLKRFGLLPIFSSARVLALRHGIRLRATADRLRAAADLDAAPRSLVSELADSHRIFLRQILRQQLRDLAAGQKLTNAVAVAELSEHEMEELKWALRQVPQVLNLLGTPPRL